MLNRCQGKHTGRFTTTAPMAVKGWFTHMQRRINIQAYTVHVCNAQTKQTCGKTIMHLAHRLHPPVGIHGGQRQACFKLGFLQP